MCIYIHIHTQNVEKNKEAKSFMEEMIIGLREKKRGKKQQQKAKKQKKQKAEKKYIESNKIINM